ncbi:Aberrant root formation protein 4 [Apostasia shenzhenica]|uniref:Aberrant root formation protein 4 n=1 Tax=Apostasia shenzhenica TaxID=1088818 RepID=A0A2H9ZU66_9ASPA|nr:Aberrant root formation protein 4 [Apostasia shenzhenica]
MEEEEEDGRRREKKNMEEEEEDGRRRRRKKKTGEEEEGRRRGRRKKKRQTEEEEAEEEEDGRRRRRKKKRQKKKTREEEGNADRDGRGDDDCNGDCRRELALRPESDCEMTATERGRTHAENLGQYIRTGETNHTGIMSEDSLHKAYSEWLLPLKTLISTIEAKNKKDDSEFAESITCALAPVQLVLHRCIESGRAFTAPPLAASSDLAGPHASARPPPQAAGVVRPREAAGGGAGRRGRIWWREGGETIGVNGNSAYLVKKERLLTRDLREEICTDESVPNKSVGGFDLIEDGIAVKERLLRSAMEAAEEEFGKHEVIAIEGGFHEKGVDLEEITVC